MYKSINQWSFPADMSLRDMMKLAKSCGFDGFEPAIGEEGELSVKTSDQDVSAIRDMADEIGIRLSSLASGMTWGCSPTATDVDTRLRARANCRRQIECANLMGVDAVLIVPGTVGVGFWGSDDPVEYDECWERAIENLNALKDDAEQLGVTIGVENVWNNFLMSPLEMARFIDEVKSPFVGAYLDVGNVVKFGMPETWVRILGDRICRVHVKDYRREVGTLAGFTDLLSGDVNFAAVINALNDIGYTGPLTAEMNAGYSGYFHDVPYRTAQALRLILGER